LEEIWRYVMVVLSFKKRAQTIQNKC
jgi:hypothetical protein